MTNANTNDSHLSPTPFKLDLPKAVCDDACTQKAIAHVAAHCPVHETVASMEDVGFTINFGEK